MGDQPLANSYHKGEVLPTYPLRVRLCTNCYLSYLSVVVDPDDMFRNYLYVSGTTATLRNHWKELAADAVSRVGVGKVLDIACNDCMPLEQFRDLGCEVLGVDPAINLREISKQKNIDVIVDYWKPGLVEDESFDIITAANVVGHTDDVKSFLEIAKSAIKPNGIIIIEFPYAKHIFDNVAFDQFYHEHVSEFIIHAFYRLLNRVDLKVDDIMLTPIHGGSIRFFLKKNLEDHCDKLYEMIHAEGGAGLLKKETYLAYGARVNKNRDDLVKLAHKVGDIVAFGASAKGNTMLNYFKLKFKYVVDDNSMKWGLFTPGMDIAICDPNDLAKEPNDLHIVLTAWNFAKEIKEKVRRIRGHNRDKFVFYVPNVRIE